MTDRAEELLTELETVCAAMGYPVGERDRVLPVQENQTPLVIVRTNSERLAPPNNANLLNFKYRWVMNPSVEVYISGSSPSQIRAELNAAWAAFYTAFFASKIVKEKMLTEGTIPDLERVVQSPSANPKIAGQVFETELFFNRNF